MYVVDTSIGSIETMKITVINSSGFYWVVDVLPEFTIDKLKLMALSHFFNPIDSIKVSDRYKLILVSQNRPLPDESTIRDEEIRENDELLLLRRRPLSILPSESQEEKEEKCRGPTEAEIQKETANLHSKNIENSIENPPVPVDFHTELRKILVSLVKVSEKLLRYHPEVVALFKEMTESEEAKEVVHVDKTSLKQLTDMGFPESKAFDALKQNSNVSDAMDWLLAHSVDGGSSSSEPVPKSSSSPTPCRKFSKLNVSKIEKPAPVNTQKEQTELPSTSQGATASSEDSRLVEMIQCFRAYKRKVFRPSTAALANLKEMGFAEADILDALRMNGNDQDSACDWLLSDKKPNFEDVEGLDPEGPIYKSIMSNAVVQLGLSNPKTFLALLHMLENPTSACRWLSDPDIAPVLSQIFRIYHAEKHSLQLARPFPQ
ncbi:ubiquitin-associated domain-containing protein 1-like isoform X2 [Stegodyphus dumicola]|uniref:ubiquitin-associated domain-containing protein 1-like isoform X2 n=1 Tax=Stegodyphus dumicola TaxID=202533 RepID=UPI0015AE53DF|nr:ubiquitin-associated domain-containing protein 1-like isoform X2 [Stegodyphus dumicola]